MEEHSNLVAAGGRSIVFCGSMLLGLGCTGSSPSDPPVSETRPRPNILFIYADDHAYQAISAYGSVLNRTPNIDRIASEGMRFEHCLVTNSICGPMRAVIQTGKYSHVNGFMVNGNQFDGSQPTFPKLLQQAGYQTAVIGKWHLGTTPQGFDYFEVLPGQGEYYNPEMKTIAGTVQHEGYVTDIITELTLDWLEGARDPNKPFFLMYQHKAPHRRWEPGPEHLTMYDEVTLPEPATLFDDYASRENPARHQDMTIAETMDSRDLKLEPPPTLTAEQKEIWDAAYGPKNDAMMAAELEGAALVRWKYQRYVKDYLRTVASIDDNLGRVLDYLDASGLAENTVVVYTSDQGFYLGEHGWFDKRWMYEPSLKTPLLVRWPGVIPEGSINEDLVSPLDFPETFLEIAGIEVPEDMQGRSLMSILRGDRPSDWRESFYYHYYEYPSWHYVRRHYGVTDGRFKLMHFYEPDVDAWEMYDVETDPEEIHNLYRDPSLGDLRERLRTELFRLREELNVPAQDPPASIIESPVPRVRPPGDR